MKKNTKTIVWSIVGLAVATGAFFGISALVKKSNRSKLDNTPMTQADADFFAKTIFGLTPSTKRSNMIQDLKDKGYNYVDGKAVKI